MKTSFFLLSSVAALALGIAFGLAIAQTALTEKPLTYSSKSTTPSKGRIKISDPLQKASSHGAVKLDSAQGWQNITTRLAASQATPM